MFVLKVRAVAPFIMKKTKILWFILTLIPIALILLGYVFPSAFFSNQESIRSFVESFGVFAPLIFVILQIVQVVVTPFSHYAVSIAGGFIFGIWFGFLLNWIGRVIGTIIAFYIGRKAGRKLVKHVVKPKNLKKYDFVFEKGKILLFLAYFLPFFPDDELSYLAGISKLSAKVFVPLIILGHLSGSLFLAYIGSGINSMKEPLFIVLSIITLIAGVLFVVFYRRRKL